MGAESHDDENWPTPGQTGHSILNPAGPFRPVRRILTYLFVGSFVGGVVAAVINQFVIAYFLGSGAGLAGAIWIGLWFVDTILAYLKR